MSHDWGGEAARSSGIEEDGKKKAGRLRDAG